MSSLESLISSATTDTLVQSLSFVLPNAASYVLSRYASTFWPLGGNSYGAGGVRQLRFTISDASQFADLSTLRINLRVNVATGSSLLFALPPQAMFGSCRLLLAGQLIEHIDYCPRLISLLHACDPKERAEQDETEAEWRTPIDGGTSRMISFPLSQLGFLQCGKMLFLRHAPLTLELNMVTDWADVLVDGAAPGSNPWGSGTHGAVGTDATVVTDASFTITDVTLKMDTCVCSRELTAMYNDHLIVQQKSLPIAFTSWATSIHSWPAGTPSVLDIQTTRALSKLRSVFVTFRRAPTAAEKTALIAAGGPNTAESMLLSPLNAAASGSNNEGPEWQLSCGSRVWPTVPVRSAAETFSSLRQTLDMSIFGVLNIDKAQWRKNRYIIAVDLERAGNAGSSANFTGLSTRGGEPIILHIRRWPGAVQPSHAYIHLFYDAVVNIEAAGVSLAD